MTRKFGVWAVAACAAMSVGITGCGEDKKDSGSGIEKLPAKEISDKAKQELLNAKSLRIAMDQTTPEGTMKFDLALDSEGNCSGSMHMGSEGSFEIVKRGDKVWMKPDEAFWKTQAGADGEAAAELFKGKYVHGTTKDDMLKDMADMCDLADFQKEMGGDDKEDGPMTKGAVTTVDGQQVIPVNGKSDEGDPMTIYVATEGAPYPLKLEQKGKDGGTMTLSDWNEPVPSKTPSVAESIDVAKLEKELGQTA